MIESRQQYQDYLIARSQALIQLQKDMLADSRLLRIQMQKCIQTSRQYREHSQESLFVARHLREKALLLCQDASLLLSTATQT